MQQQQQSQASYQHSESRLNEDKVDVDDNNNTNGKQNMNSTSVLTKISFDMIKCIMKIIRKQHKCHRCVLDQDTAFLKSI